MMQEVEQEEEGEVGNRSREEHSALLFEALKANTISYEELKKLIAEGKARIFDVRSAGEVASGHIANSVNIPVAEVETAFRMDPESFRRKYGVEKPGMEEKNLIFHCQIGKRGAKATETAKALGYAKARNYTGGYKEWSEKERL